MPKLDEYYHLLRTHEPPLAEDALRASIRAAVERVHLETLGGVEGLTETSVQGVSELAAASVSSAPFVAAAGETGTTLLSSGFSSGFFLGGGFGAIAIFAGLAVVGVLALAVGLWQVREGQYTVSSGIPAQSKQTQAMQDTSPVSFATSPQGQEHRSGEQMPEQSNAASESSKNAAFSQRSFSASPTQSIYDNTEELMSPPSSRASTLDTKHETKHSPMQMLEMIEQERHRDSLGSSLAQSTSKKRDAARQRQHDLLLVLIQRARECILAPHQHTFKGVPCSLPVAMKGETTLDCILVMLEQQSVLLHDATLTYLTQQTRREKALPALNVLESYVKEYY